MAETYELSHVVNLFQKNLIYMPGGHDLDDNCIIVVNDEISTLSFDELNMCVRYLAQLNQGSKNATETFAIIINDQNNFISQRRILLQHVQVILEKRLKCVYHVSKPTKRKMSFKKEKNQYPFKYLNVSLERLQNHVNPSELPTELGGNLTYRHHIWIEQHLAFERYRRQVSVIGGQFDGHLTRLNMMSTSCTAGDVIRERRILHPQIVDPAEKLIISGQELYRDIRGALDTRMSQPMLDAVQRLVSTLANSIDTLQSILSDRQKSFQVDPRTAQLQILMRTIIDWISGSGKLPEELGQDLRQTKDLMEDHGQLKVKSLDAFAAYAELCNKMESSGQQGHLGTQKAFVDHICSGFACDLERRSELLEVAAAFHKPAEALYKIFTNAKWPTLDEISKIEDISVYISEIEVEIKVIDDLLSATTRASDDYITILSTRYMNSTSCYYETCDRILHAVHVLRHGYATYELHMVVYRIRLVLSDKLHFARGQLEQVYEWINELSANMLKDHDAAEMLLIQDTAKNVYAYAQEMLDLNLLLQRILELPEEKILPDAYLYELNTMYRSICMLASHYTLDEVTC